MNISREKFEETVKEVLDSMSEKFQKKLNNLAIFVEDYPTKEQLGKVGRNEKYGLFGLFEGYHQAKRLNYGPVLPDRITIFRKPICRHSGNEKELREKIESTVKHEIAHHFGSDETGARKAGRIK